MGKKIFFSYADSDSRYFQIPRIVRTLELQREIDKVNYWERDAKTDISDFMFEEVVKCDIFVVFCTKYSIHSMAVKQEWEFALSFGKHIIPVFEDIHEIPAPLRMKRGIEIAPSSNHKRKRLKDPVVIKLIEDLITAILDGFTGTVTDFEQYQKILDKIKDDHLIQEFLDNFHSKINV